MEVLIARVAAIGLICAALVGIAGKYEEVQMAKAGYCERAVEVAHLIQYEWRPCKPSPAAEEK